MTKLEKKQLEYLSRTIMPELLLEPRIFNHYGLS